MLKTVTFSLSFLRTLVDWETKQKSFYARRKDKRHNHFLIEEIYNHCRLSLTVQNDDEIDQSENSKQMSTQKRAICRFLNNKGNNLELGFAKKQVARRSRDALGIQNTPPPKKQTRFQSQLCQASNCEWKQKFEAKCDENLALQAEIDSLKSKMEQFQSQTQSTQKSSQSQPWKESTIKLLQFQQNGNVTRFSAQMIRLAIYLLIACYLSANCIPLVICGILNAAEFKNLKLPKYGYFTKIRSALAYLNRARMLKFCSDATEICICFDGTSLSTKQGGVFGLTVMNEKAQNHLIAMIEHNEKDDDGPQHVLDVRMIIQTLKNTVNHLSRLLRNDEKRSAVFTASCHGSIIEFRS